MIERFFVGPDALIGPLDGSFRRGISPPAGGELLCPWRLVVAKSTRLRFRLVAKTALVPLLLLFPANPLRWASPGGTREITQNATGDAADGLRLRFAPPRSIGPPPYPLCRYATSPPDRGSRPRTPVTGVTPWSRQNPSGVQNLSDDLNPRRATGAWVCKNCSCCGSTTAPGFAEPTCLVQNMGYLIRPLWGHLPLKGKAFKWHPPAFPFRGRWHAKRDG